MSKKNQTILAEKFDSFLFLEINLRGFHPQGTAEDKKLHFHNVEALKSDGLKKEWIKSQLQNKTFSPFQLQKHWGLHFP